LKAVPPLMIEHLGVDGILARVPENYVGSIVAAWVASRFVYQYGISASEVSFFFFMRSLITCGDYKATATAGAGGQAKRPAEGEEKAGVRSAEEGRSAVRQRLG